MNRSALWVGAGCLGCIGVPSLLAIGGAGGYLMAQRREPVALIERESFERGDDSWESSSLRARREEPVVERPVVKEPDEREEIAAVVRETATPVVREVVVATPVVARPTATPELAKIAAPISTPVVKELAKVAAPISTPAVAKALKDVAKAAPIPKSTPRNFDDEIDLKPTKPAKPSKTPAIASAAGGGAPTETPEDIAVADLFGDAPGGSASPAVAAAPAAPAAVSSAKIRTIKTRGGPVQVTLGKKIALSGADKKPVLGTLEKVEGGWVAIRLGDGKVKILAESDIVEASEL